MTGIPWGNFSYCLTILIIKSFAVFPHTVVKHGTYELIYYPTGWDVIQEKYVTWDSMDIDSMDSTQFYLTVENSQRNLCADL